MMKVVTLRGYISSGMFKLATSKHMMCCTCTFLARKRPSVEDVFEVSTW
jgi:hypothetical protein